MTEVKIKNEISLMKKHHNHLLVQVLMFVIIAEFLMVTISSVYFCQIFYSV